jgi:uncharacterized membrane protein
MSKKNAWIVPVIIGAVLVLVGFCMKMPGGALTTYGSLDGESTEYYTFDDTYSAIDEYVGGDAYNYIIGASLVAGKIAGTMTTKAICIVGGFMCIAFGVALLMLTQPDSKKQAPAQHALPAKTETIEVSTELVQPTTEASIHAE